MADQPSIRERINTEARLLGYAIERGDKVGIIDTASQLHKLADEAKAIASAWDNPPA